MTTPAPLLWRDAMRPRTQLAHRLDIITHVDMDPRLRNELLVDVYLDLSEDVAAAIHGYDVPAEQVRPNFYSYAIWGAHTVGVQLQRRWMPGAVRRARALESGNARLLNHMGAAGLEFRQRMDPMTYWEVEPRPAPPTRQVDEHHDDNPGGDHERHRPESERAPEADRSPGDAPGGHHRRSDEGGPDADTGGRTARGPARLTGSFLSDGRCALPRALLDEAGCDHATLSEAIDKIRDRGLALYEQATRLRIDETAGRAATELDEATRRERDLLVLRGNAWLAISEQALIQDEIAVAARINVRRWLTPPWHRMFMSQRVWRERPVGGWQTRLERWFASWATRRMLVFHHAPGSVTFRGRRSRGELPIVRWYPEARATLTPDEWRGLGSPFELVTEVDAIGSWPCLRERLAAIMVLMATTHDEPWFVDLDPERPAMPHFRNAHVPRRWRGYPVAVAALDGRLRAPWERR